LGGGRVMNRLVDIAVTPDAVRDLLVVVVLDLSRISRVVDDLMYWLELLRKRVDACLTKLRDENSDLPVRLLALARERYKDPKDIEKASPIPVPILIVGNKHDLFQEQVTDVERQKVMACTLRSIAHYYGCSLLYTTRRSVATLQTFRSRIGRHAGNKGSSIKAELNPLQPLNVSAGQDTFRDIGNSPSHSLTSAHHQGWIAAFGKIFERRAADYKEDAGTVISDIKLEPEPLIDALLLQKNEDLRKLQQSTQIRRKIKQVDYDYKERAIRSASASSTTGSSTG